MFPTQTMVGLLIYSIVGVVFGDTSIKQDGAIRNLIPKNPIRGVTFVEVEKYIIIKFSKEQDFNRNCDRYDCAMYNRGWFGQPTAYDLWKGEIRENYFQLPGQNIYVCYGSEGTSRLYEWIKPGGGPYYGQPNHTWSDDNCEQLWNEKVGYKSDQCKFCGFTALNTHKVDTTSQYADLGQNMIVTGVQLVRVNNTIGIKLRQGKLLEGAIIEKESNTWKELDWNELRTRNFNDVTNSMQLDDVVLPPHHVVGGVRLMWAANKYGFRIEVLGVPYNAITGKLEIWTPVWYNSEGNADVAKLPEAVKREEIPQRQADSPINANDFKVVEGTNKFIKFNHTSLEKDLGQTVVPLLDAQPLTIDTGRPLRGIGLFYYAAVGDYGGYIAPKLFPY